MLPRSTRKRQRSNNRGSHNEQQPASRPNNAGLDAVMTSQGQQVKSRRVCLLRRVSTHAMSSTPNVPGDSMFKHFLWPHCYVLIVCNFKIFVPAAFPSSPLELSKPTFCHHCFAKKFAFETKNFCCGDGKIRIASNEWPSELKRLYMSTDEDALHFQKYARIYNNLFAFSSIGGGMAANTKKGIYVFRLQGQLYHFVPDLIPTDGRPKYLQLYFYDGEHEKENRLGQLPNLRADVMERLMTIMQATSSARGKKRTMLSCRDYYAYKLQIRPGNHLLRSCRLFQQFIVDMYVKLENTRLDFFRQNQKLIRSDLYQGILDSLAIGERNANNVGHRVVLPPSFIGGSRDMTRRYLNAMALVQRYGKPDIFLTMTCNPKWKEIEDELEAGEKAENRPDVVARIFRAKLMVLKKKIMEEEFFGPVAGMIYVVEFQKRGLPHAHFLIILERAYKIRAPEQFDKYVCAEIPSEDKPYLRSLVLKHMMHGPCGSMFPECPCMQQKGDVKRCRSNYPKKHVEFTTNNSDGYPLYRRRHTGETVTVRKFGMDNRWVIPYNPKLLAEFDCHINVEVCSTITAVKYLYKYVYKGHDKVSFSLASADKQVDEINAFQYGRWVSPPEAAWRIFGFDLYDMVPSVLPLQVHLPNQQCVSFAPNETVQYIARSSHKYESQLTAFFKMNAAQAERSKLLYSRCPEEFVWNKEQKIWTPRIGRVQVGRLVFVSPGEGERYFLRLLLCHVPGPTSFDDLLTVHGRKCETFKQAAIKRGLVEADDAIDQCLKEASEFQMPKAFRQLFATTLVFSQPAQPRVLWEKYFKSLSEDFKHAYPDDQIKILHLTCKDIEQMMKPCGKSFGDFDLPDLHQLAEQQQNPTCSREVFDALTAPVPPDFIGLWKKLNAEQRQAYKTIIRCVKQKRAGAFFIDGPGGTGKTFLYCAIYAKIRMMGKIVIATASSGIAASNIPSGRKAHSRFKIPLDADNSLACNVPKQSDLAQLLREAAVIIWDEASMARKENVEAVDRLLQDMCTCVSPFGGKVFVFGGDFRQVLPVIPKRAHHELVDASLVSSYLWPLFKRFTLVENMRAKEDPNFTSFLLKLGNGEFQTDEQATITLPPSLLCRLPNSNNCLDYLVASVYPDINQLAANPHAFTARATLTPTNDEVDCINKLVIDKFPGEAYVFKSYDSTIDDDCNAHPVEFLNTLCPGGMSPHNLILKLNCPVILLRNLNPSIGLCNGTRLICRGFKRNVVICEIATGYRAGEYVFIPRISLRPSASITYPYKFERRQFPIKLCFAMTINKSQGQTLTNVAVYLRRPCFSHGQLYVALSRAKKASSVKVFIDDNQLDDSVPPSVTNVVSFDLLRKAGIL